MSAEAGLRSVGPYSTSARVLGRSCNERLPQMPCLKIAHVTQLLLTNQLTLHPPQTKRLT